MGQDFLDRQYSKAMLAMMAFGVEIFDEIYPDPEADVNKYLEVIKLPISIKKNYVSITYREKFFKWSYKNSTCFAVKHGKHQQQRRRITVYETNSLITIH